MSRECLHTETSAGSTPRQFVTSAAGDMSLLDDWDLLGEIDWEHPGIHRGNLITCAGSERVTDRVYSIK